MYLRFCRAKISSYQCPYYLYKPDHDKELKKHLKNLYLFPFKILVRCLSAWKITVSRAAH